MPISSTQEIIDELRAGHMVILVDDEDRENEGDLMIAADFVTPEAINFMAKHARGLVCLTLTQERCNQLGLSPMTRDNRSSFNTAFTTSIEAATGVTTGISAFDRARTIQVAVARDASPGRYRPARPYFSHHRQTGGGIATSRTYGSRLRPDSTGGSDTGISHMRNHE